MLSRSSTVGGWTLIAFGLAFAILPTLGLLGTIPFGAEDDHNATVGFFTATLVGVGLGFWMMRSQKQRVVSILRSDLTEVPATVTAVSGYHFPMGFYVDFELDGPAGMQAGTQRYIALPPWSVGDDAPVLIAAGRKRFFPANQDVPADLGKIKGDVDG